MIGIISDIHGNYPALCAVMQKLDENGITEIISLGDVAGYYCMINECIDLLRYKKVVNILGNHDHYIISGNKCPRSTSANILLDYQRGVLTKENREWLSRSINIWESESISLRHGGWRDYLDEYIYKFDFSNVLHQKFKIYASGHTHIQQIEEKNGKIYFNPGSVGQPRDNDPRAAYAIIRDDMSVVLGRTVYDIDAICKTMREQGFYERVYSCLYCGKKIGG